MTESPQILKQKPPLLFGESQSSIILEGKNQHSRAKLVVGNSSRNRGILWMKDARVVRPKGAKSTLHLSFSVSLNSVETLTMQFACDDHLHLGGQADPKTARS